MRRYVVSRNEIKCTEAGHGSERPVTATAASYHACTASSPLIPSSAVVPTAGALESGSQIALFRLADRQLANVRLVHGASSMLCVSSEASVVRSAAKALY